MSNTREIELTRDYAYNETREKIQTLHAKQKKLEGAINEFFQVQQTFHDNITTLVNAFGNLIDLPMLVPLKPVLEEILKPYEILVHNPFGRPSDNFEANLIKIMSVINNQNAIFKQTLEATHICITNLEKFNLVLKELEIDQGLTNELSKKHLSWFRIKDYASQTFQNLMRYKILLDAIEENLPKEKEHPHTHLVGMVRSTSSYMEAAVDNVNDNMALFSILERIVATVKKVEKTIPQKSEQAENLRVAIQAILEPIKEAKKRIIKDFQQMVPVYINFAEMLETLLQLYDSVQFEQQAPAQSYQERILAATAEIKDYTGKVLFYPLSFFYSNPSEPTPNEIATEVKALIAELIEISQRAAPLVDKLEAKHYVRDNSLSP